jgi:hypothetical protein
MRASQVLFGNVRQFCNMGAAALDSTQRKGSKTQRKGDGVSADTRLLFLLRLVTPNTANAQG